MATMEEELANLKITEEEEEPVQTLEDEDTHPLEGVSIMEIEENRILFRFYNKIDLKRVWDGMLWFFNRHLIILHQMIKGKDHVQVPLFHTTFWDGMTSQFGNFIEQFIEYGVALIAKGVRNFMIKMDWDKDGRRRKFGNAQYDQNYQRREGG
ncbi:hypothetical protein CXB51_032486 [Gossypium anomalum]|uniref:DUF4283 domain-containing protein n=1 Tax=Gossypium anomalum TaxID=47600 RepID=A0A8J5YSA6_9ROSI|nr:hypothetical protein CXB51_032486 [Gossypium anomalum]